MQYFKHSLSLHILEKTFQLPTCSALLIYTSQVALYNQIPFDDCISRKKSLQAQLFSLYHLWPERLTTSTPTFVCSFIQQTTECSQHLSLADGFHHLLSHKRMKPGDRWDPCNQGGYGGDRGEMRLTHLAVVHPSLEPLWDFSCVRAVDRHPSTPSCHAEY